MNRVVCTVKICRFRQKIVPCSMLQCGSISIVCDSKNSTLHIGTYYVLSMMLIIRQ